ncbi:MAG: hypothetical protein M3O36_00330, partial [Myxococcota bacterium]|nr:hypothetical protein [Myxococcota bacterium]
CNAPELPRVLSAWLEAMSPANDGGELAAESSEHEGAGSSAERVTLCMASLKAYPRLYRSVVPLLAGVSEAAPPSA